MKSLTSEAILYSGSRIPVFLWEIESEIEQ